MQPSWAGSRLDGRSVPETLAPWREPVLASVPQPLHVACAHQTDVAQRVQDPHGVERVRRRAPIAPYRRRPPWSGRDRPPRYHVVTLVGTHSRPGRNRARHAIRRRTHLGAPQGGRSGSRARGRGAGAAVALPGAPGAGVVRQRTPAGPSTAEAERPRVHPRGKRPQSPHRACHLFIAGAPGAARRG